jgi:hypothetical protein
MASDFVIVTSRITDVNVETGPVEIEFKTPNADPTKPSVLLLERRNVNLPMPVELNGVGVPNGVRRNGSEDFHGQALPIAPGTLHNGTKPNVLRLKTGAAFTKDQQVDNIVLFYTSKRLGPPAKQS